MTLGLKVGAVEVPRRVELSCLGWKTVHHTVGGTYSGLPTQELALQEYRGRTNRYTGINNNPRISNSTRRSSVFCVLTMVNLHLPVLY